MEIIDDILNGNRLALARLLTQIENNTSESRLLLNELFPYTGQAYMIGITGAPGTGKSTLVKLLLRFYDPINGQVFLDGVNIRKLNLQDYRRRIGLVNQDTFLIDGTLRENIAYGQPDISMKEIIEAAKVAEVHDFIILS